MKYLISLLLFITPFTLIANENDWMIKAKIESRMNHDRIWMNNKGEFYWAPSFFFDGMPCNTKLNDSEVIELSSLIKSLPSEPYKREFNNQCKHTLDFFIMVSTEQLDGSFIEVGKEFPASLDCRVDPVDKSWDDLSSKLHILTKEHFKTCRSSMY